MPGRQCTRSPTTVLPVYLYFIYGAPTIIPPTPPAHTDDDTAEPIAAARLPFVKTHPGRPRVLHTGILRRILSRPCRGTRNIHTAAFRTLAFIA